MKEKELQIRNIFPDEANIPELFRMKDPVVQREYLVNGEMRRWTGEMQEVVSPVYVKSPSGLSENVLGAYPLVGEKEGLEALEAAVAAYNSGRGLWPSLSLHERIASVETFVSEMVQVKEEILRLLMWEIGKSYEGGLKEFDRTVECIRNTFGAVERLDRSSSQFIVEESIIGKIRRAPLGVVLCMGPYNYPLNETLATLIPALIMGNTSVVKPPKLGVLLYSPLLKAFRKAFPAGVVNIIYGDGKRLVPPILRSGKIDVLAFIGSGRVAEIVKSYHPRPQRLRAVLGLEAKNPAIVLPDADIDAAVKECVRGSLSFNGQRCTALKILFVHSGIAKEFVERFADEVSSLRCGMPWEKDVFITPLPDADRIRYLGELMKDAEKCGARIVNKSGGCTNITFFYPALLYPVDSRMRIYHEEQFGPLVPVVPFDDIEAPVRYCIESSYGQQASIFGRDIAALGKLVDVLVNQVCRVNINSICQRGPDVFPFAGRKDSSEGTLSVSDALEAFSIRTIVATKDVNGNREIITGIVREGSSSFLSERKS
ncbi:MAG: NADP-dependent glyceraldehyde-3-phosphate dehydrogenase [Nitrospirota bacterium]